LGQKYESVLKVKVGVVLDCCKSENEDEEGSSHVIFEATFTIFTWGKSSKNISVSITGVCDENQIRNLSNSGLWC
jgi:hypothetical protein